MASVTIFRVRISIWRTFFSISLGSFNGLTILVRLFFPGIDHGDNQDQEWKGFYFFARSRYGQRIQNLLDDIFAGLSFGFRFVAYNNAMTKDIHGDGLYILGGHIAAPL